MAVGIYKQGQGYWVRLMSAIGFGLLSLMGVAWLWDQVNGIQIGDIEPVFVSAAIWSDAEAQALPKECRVQKETWAQVRTFRALGRFGSLGAAFRARR